MSLENQKHSTILTNKDYELYWKVAKEFLTQNGMIRNRQLREITGMGYDQAIRFFNRAIAEGSLEREGEGGSTRYVLID